MYARLDRRPYVEGEVVSSHSPLTFCASTTKEGNPLSATVLNLTHIWWCLKCKWKAVGCLPATHAKLRDPWGQLGLDVHLSNRVWWQACMQHILLLALVPCRSSQSPCLPGKNRGRNFPTREGLGTRLP